MIPVKTGELWSHVRDGIPDNQYRRVVGRGDDGMNGGRDATQQQDGQGEK